ncbi:hypothetical protein [Vibrio sp. OPT18]|uniref:hypothetical protein n=1 Tax=Vibrio sp. OPT18 TaxID=2778641 RepID=UPI0018825D1C|nr:hypothetical protein [Vibrio sp. OPT18]MBE8574048.1 hypothetical protein [Vibrio sp. OPT18]
MSIVINQYIAAIADKENDNIEHVRKWSLEVIMTIEIKKEWKEISNFLKGCAYPPLDLEILNDIDYYVFENPILDYHNLKYKFDIAEKECKKYEEIHGIQTILDKYKSLN